MKLTHEQVERVTLCPDGPIKVMRELAIDKPVLDELLLDEGIEQCPSCGWYTETTWLLDGDAVDGYCDNCRPTRKE